MTSRHNDDLREIKKRDRFKESDEMSGRERVSLLDRMFTRE